MKRWIGVLAVVFSVVVSGCSHMGSPRTETHKILEHVGADVVNF